ncbi:MAG: replication-associated recombination protein A [Acidobacteria bacterium]|nr:replication-associated recombination protein A [Acidobacteriota bacterium]
MTRSLFGDDPVAPLSSTPLAERMRPRSLDEYVGQDHLVGPGQPLRRAIDAGALHSLILWGPPGTGKTTLARVIAAASGAEFAGFSAVTSGIKEIKEVISRADYARRQSGRRTIFFVDEIHRFNKAQQDAFLPHIESGAVVLIGATTENPSFEVNSALLSRSKVYVLQPLALDRVVAILERALVDAERGLAALLVTAEPEALTSLARYANGDARVALNLLEQVTASLAVDQRGHRVLDAATLAALIERRALLYDKTGDEHYNIISALHKSIRNSDADAAVYWLARMLEAGEDPMYVARRLVRFASEDIGNADPRALQLAIAAKDATHFLGMPECNAALAQLVIYLAASPKSNAAYVAYTSAAKDALQHEAAPVPLHLRNAPTALMKSLDFGKDYKYSHDEPDAVADMSCLPESLAGRRYYKPTERGLEPKLRDALDRARRRKT